MAIMINSHPISAMARAGCTSARGIRFWQEQGLLGEVVRSDGDTRRYTDAQLDRARIIAAAQFGGWALDGIKEMLAEWGEEARGAILLRLSDQMRAAARLAENLPKVPASTMEYDL